MTTNQLAAERKLSEIKARIASGIRFYQLADEIVEFLVLSVRDEINAFFAEKEKTAK